MVAWRKLTAFIVLFCFTTVYAQSSTCTDLTQQAVKAVEAACATTGRNQACYGNASLTATARDGIPAFSFQKQGDLADVADLQSLELKQFDPANDVWGVALMKIQASLPDTLPGQNVTLLLFGDVKIENAVSNVVTMTATVGGNINVRTGPATGYAVAAGLKSGQSIIADGRSADSSWLRIQIPDSSALGWVSAGLVAPAGDVSQLNVVDPSQAEVPLKPMQAFYFQTGIGRSSCTQAPPSGILVQTPKGVGKISLRANDVDIQLGSTAYLQAQSSQKMTISVIQGESLITADGGTVVVPAGARVNIPMDEDLKASGEPEDPVPYDLGEYDDLPVDMLDEDFEIAPPIDEDALSEAELSFDDGSDMFDTGDESDISDDELDMEDMSDDEIDIEDMSDDELDMSDDGSDMSDQGDDGSDMGGSDDSGSSDEGDSGGDE